jgi:hypothetical protein
VKSDFHGRKVSRWQELISEGPKVLLQGEHSVVLHALQIRTSLAMQEAPVAWQSACTTLMSHRSELG